MMNIRDVYKRQEQRELKQLSPYAAHSLHSKGRERQEEECDVRTVYQRDRDRILHCKAFRRMKDKTQVFLAPQGDHYRTRMTHTLEVSQIARTIAKALSLNEDLVEAIALGHDLGHTPFGHAGERALNKVNPDGFAHYKQSVRDVYKRQVFYQSGDKIIHEWINTCIISSSCKNQLGIAESIADCLGHIVSCKIIDQDFGTSSGFQFISK